MLTFKKNIVNANKLFSEFSHEVFFDAMIGSAEIGTGDIVIATKYEFRQWLDNMITGLMVDIQNYSNDLETAEVNVGTLMELFADVRAWKTLSDDVEYIIFDNGHFLVKK